MVGWVEQAAPGFVCFFRVFRESRVSVESSPAHCLGERLAGHLPACGGSTPTSNSGGRINGGGRNGERELPSPHIYAT